MDHFVPLVTTLLSPCLCGNSARAWNGDSPLTAGAVHGVVGDGGAWGHWLVQAFLEGADGVLAVGCTRPGCACGAMEPELESARQLLAASGLAHVRVRVRRMEKGAAAWVEKARRDMQADLFDLGPAFGEFGGPSRVNAHIRSQKQ